MLEQKQVEALCEQVTSRLAHLTGPWVGKNANYELGLCAALEWSCIRERYRDATWNSVDIEIKKGHSVWLDLVRYSELLTMRPPPQDSFTTFFLPNKEKTAIARVLGVRTSTLIRQLHLTESLTENLLVLHRVVPRSLNAQASLTVKDISLFCDFDISTTEPARSQ